MRLDGHGMQGTGRSPPGAPVPGWSDRECSGVTAEAGHTGDWTGGEQDLGRTLHIVLTCCIGGT